jgi:predicted phage-related endonuclease
MTNEVNTMTKIEQLCAMLHGLIARVVAGESITELYEARIEISRILKIDLSKIEAREIELAMEKIGDRESVIIDNISIEYHSSERFALDQKKVREQFSTMSDDEYKSLVYSHSIGEKKLKIKKI